MQYLRFFAVFIDIQPKAVNPFSKRSHPLRNFGSLARFSRTRQEIRNSPPGAASSERRLPGSPSGVSGKNTQARSTRGKEHCHAV